MQRPNLRFDDPVEEAAPLAHRLAERHCRKDAVSGESCAWYHGSRLAFRALGIGRGSLPEAHRIFFDKALADCAGQTGFDSVLVSGSADYAMPALVLNAYSSLGKPPQLTVVDICRTPLLINDWYATRHCIAVEVRHCDILDYRAEQPADIVCTHHFFNHFAPDARASVVEKWRSLLRPGGKVILVNRYHTTGRPQRGGYPEAEGAALLAAARAALRHRSDPFPFSDAEIEEMVRTYRARIRAHSLASPEELFHLLQSAGFAVEVCRLFSDTRVGTGDGASGDATAEAIGVIARRL